MEKKTLTPEQFEQPLPPAEGAEIDDAYAEIGVYDIANKWAVLARVNEVGTRDAMIIDFYELLNAHAQRLADKMGEERLREELIKYDKHYWGHHGDSKKEVDAYLEYRKNLKSRDSHG